MDLLLNELSLATPAKTVAEGRARIAALLETVRAAREYGIGNVVRTCQDFWGTPLSDGYGISHWVADAEVDLELRRLLKAAVGKGPFLDEPFLPGADEPETLSEFSVGGQCGKALEVAVRLEEPLLSAAVSPWNVDPVEVECLTLTNEGDTETTEKVCNLASPGVVASRESWLRERTRQQVRTGRDVVQRFVELFGRLQLTDTAREQLTALSGNEQPFPFLLKHLAAIDAHVRTWKQGPFVEGYPFDISEESEQTLAQFGGQRTFRCPDGAQRTFSLHSKVRVGEWRIYFIPDRSSGTALVGYVGRHLPTVRFRT